MTYFFGGHIRLGRVLKGLQMRPLMTAAPTALKQYRDV